MIILFLKLANTVKTAFKWLIILTVKVLYLRIRTSRVCTLSEINSPFYWRAGELDFPTRIAGGVSWGRLERVM